MHAAFALLPSAVVLVAVLGLRASGLVAAGAAAATAALLWGSGIYGPVLAPSAVRAFADAGVLTALVAAMVVPGLLFVEATRGRKSPEAIGALVAAMQLTRPRAAILIATGIGVMVESLTGMGVSLLVTMPLLLGLFDRRSAIAIGLVGMSLMPWGALSISAHVSAKLSGIGIEVLQAWIAAVSGPVAFLLPSLALLFVAERRRSDWLAAAVAGAILWLVIALASAWIGIEVAGVAGGLAVIIAMGAVSGHRKGLSGTLAAPGLVPYFVLLAMVVAQKLAVAPLTAAGLSPAIATERVSFAILTSPGVALLLATIFAASSQIGPALLIKVGQRAWKPVASIALFMLAARFLVECGAIAALARSLGGLGREGALVAVALLAAIGGFVTGSGVTSSALFMPSAAAAGETFGALPIFAALQNGVGGHVGMAALPVAAILLATLPARTAADDATVMRIGLALAAWHTAVATAAALLLLGWQG